MHGVAIDGGDEGQVDVGLLRVGQLHLGLLSSLLETLQGHLVVAQVDALVSLELVGEPVDDALIPVIATEMVVTVGGEDLEDTIPKLEDGDIEGAATEVEDEDTLIRAGLVKTIGEGCSRGLVDDALDLEACDLARVLGCLTLRVVEVCRHGDDGLVDLLAKIFLSVSLELLQDHGRDLLGGVVLAVDVDIGTSVLARLHVVGDGLALGLGLGVVAADETLDGRDGVLGVGDGLVLRRLADDPLPILAETDDRGGRAVTLRVDDDRWLAALEHCHGRVRGAQVDTDDLSHCLFPFVLVQMHR